MSRPLEQHIPSSAVLIRVGSKDLAGLILEHLHTLSPNQLRQASSHNIANDISRSYESFNQRIYEAIFSACQWLIKNDFLEEINSQGFFTFSEKGKRIKTLIEFQAYLSSGKEGTQKGGSETSILIVLNSFLNELNNIEASLNKEGYSKMGQRFERWKSRCVRFIAENFNEEEAKKLSRHEMLDAGTPQIARRRHNHTVVTFKECRSFLEVLLDEIEMYGEDYFRPTVEASDEIAKEDSPTSPAASLPASPVPATAQVSGGSDNSSAASQANLIHANELYSAVKSLLQDTKPVDENRARIIVESCDDAIKEFGSTNQEKKVELRQWKAQAESILPPGTIEELRKRAEGKALEKVYPRNKILRSALYVIIVLVIVASTFFVVRQMFSGQSDSTKAGPSPGIATSPQPTATLTPLPTVIPTPTLSPSPLSSPSVQKSPIERSKVTPRRRIPCTAEDRLLGKC